LPVARAHDEKEKCPRRDKVRAKKGPYSIQGERRILKDLKKSRREEGEGYNKSRRREEPYRCRKLAIQKKKPQGRNTEEEEKVLWLHCRKMEYKTSRNRKRDLKYRRERNGKLASIRAFIKERQLNQGKKGNVLEKDKVEVGKNVPTEVKTKDGQGDRAIE